MCNLVVINEVEVELEVVADQAYTTSLSVASVFNKRHDHIIAKIRELPQDDFTAPNFRVSEYKDKSGRKLPMYQITKDGLVLLAMGFTGEKAYKFKVEYIKAFNAMAEEIKRLKFEKYINEVANLNACLIDKAKRHQREIAGYKGQITQHNTLITSLRKDLALARANPQASQDLQRAYDRLKRDWDGLAKDWNGLTSEYMAVCKERNELKKEIDKRKYNQDKITETILALDKIQKHLDPVYTALGAVMAYASDNDRFFMERNEILR
ncbi:Rha family transcriptional regulator [Campylobacter sp. RM16192]|uniref:Rha family transcriptional regulator n=1 Tax=Campylobacter sp. RM16192 TaxID=1660080 RepID=UPI0014514D1D|nr:Rha family transcriptional regulator [Campylobacter sp. RM16192]QCD52804.1 phage regulatory protein, Rha family [Campylobacter sp. RM16192]